jgi:hypothetical protein
MRHSLTRKNLKGGSRKQGLTPKQHAFVSELMTDENGTRAASAAGYKNPAVLACFLQDERKYPLVVRAIREARARKELAAERKADDILRYLHTAMYFCPADYFDPGGNGGWLINRENYRNLPPEIKCLVEEMETRTIKTRAGTVHMLWVRFVSKSTAMTLAAKQQLGDKIHTTFTPAIDWARLWNGPSSYEVDPVEERIRQVELLNPDTRPMLPPPATNGFSDHE